jgi:hypothetical protein
MSQFTPPSNPLATLFHGTVTIEPGCDASSNPVDGGLYGFGDMFVSRQVQVGYNTTLPSLNPSTGSLVVHGGVGVKENANLALSLNVLGTTGNATNIRETHIDTTWGPLQVSGGNMVNMSVNNGIALASIVEPITISGGNFITIESSLNSATAIQITNKNAGGGISLLTGENSGYQLTTGNGGVAVLTSEGNISLTANHGSGSFIVNSNNSNQNLNLNLNGNTDSGILIQSAGTNASKNAIQINTTHEDGNIYITNTSSGNHDGEIQIFAGSSGLIANTNTGGSISLLARNGASSFIVDSTSANKNLTIAVTGATDSALILESQGTSGNAITMRNTDATGSILIANATAGSGGMSMYTGSGGLTASTLFGGINLTARGAASTFINQTTADSGQDLTICVKGIYGTTETQANKLILCSESVAGDSIYLRTSGGTYLSSRGQINIQTSDSTNGIHIGTLVTAPVVLGTSTSTTTIRGNLDVKGTTTTYDSTVVQIKDNFIVVNNQPGGLTPTLDGGLAVKRYQPVGNGLCGSLAGSIISDTPEFTGTITSVTSGSSSAVSVSISTTDFNTISDSYAGYWLKVTYYNGSTTGIPVAEDHSGDYCWVRRIKASTTDSTSTATFTVYNTTDQTTAAPAGLGNPVPVEGMDYPGDIVLPGGLTGDQRLTFSIYPCHWIVSMWDESNKEYALVCSRSIGEYGNIADPQHYINLHVNNIKANILTVNSINNLTADVQFTTQLAPNVTPVQLDPSTSIPTPIQLGYPYPKYGVFIILVRPKIATATSPYAVFVVGRRNSIDACGQVARLISVKGTNGEMLDMSWPANSYPNLFYRPAPDPSVGTIDFTLKFIAV